MNKKTLYLECNSGISGDMTVAALLDLGANEKVLKEALNSIPIDGFGIEISRVHKSGILVCDFNVVLDEAHENNDHNMKYLHEDNNSHNSNDKDHPNINPNNHYNKNHSHEIKHVHRGLLEILDIIDKTKMTLNAKNIAKKIFEVLASAESKAHDVDINNVHFHEVGAVDSIVDIIAVAVCFDNLSITECIIPNVAEGCGTIRCQHGILPIPVPAVVNIISQHDINIKYTNIEGELVTPTGAAIVAALKTKDKLYSSFKILKVGMGAGKREYSIPSILRAMIIEVEEINDENNGNNENNDNIENDKNNEINEKYNRDEIVKIETDIDDCTGETLGYVMELLFAAGAKDVHYIPVFMKKNRPAYELVVICSEALVSSMENIIFMETTTIGIRKQKMERSILNREIKNVETSIGMATIKVCTNGKNKNIYPEYASVSELAKQNDLSFMDTFELIKKESVNLL